MCRQFSLDHVQIMNGVSSGFEGCTVENVHYGRTAFDVSQEVVAETSPFAGTLDKSRHISDRESDVSSDDHAKIRRERGERIVGDFRPGAGYRRYQRRLPGIGVTNQPDVGHQFELQRDGSRFTFLAEQGETGRFAATGRESGVAQSAPTAPGGNNFGARS